MIRLKKIKMTLGISKLTKEIDTLPPSKLYNFCIKQFFIKRII